MIELSTVSAADPQWIRRHVQGAGTVGERSLPHRKVFRYDQLSMIVAGDEPVDHLAYEDSRLTLICRGDLAGRDSANINRRLAAHLASLYIRFGDDFVKPLRGTFAIILYEHRSRTLKAWIDHFGVERLAYTEPSQPFFGVATDLRLLTALMDACPEIDAAAIQQYLMYSCIPAGRTIYKGISRLEGADQLVAQPDVRRTRYWDMTYAVSPDAARREASLVEKTRDAIRAAVERYVVDMDPTPGCFLSGGTDSSSVAGLAGACAGAPPRTFSIGFDDPRYNEIEYARAAARHHAADHHEYFVNPADVLALIRKAAPAYDEPFGNSSIIPTYYCARLAAENGVTHLLAGDGGDELFGGNARYVDDLVFQRYHTIPAFARRYLLEPVVGMANAWQKAGVIHKAARYIRRANIPTPDRLFSYSPLATLPGAELFAPGFLETLAACDPLEPARRHYAAAPSTNALNRWLYLDLKIAIGDNDVRKVTTMARIAGVTTRYPLLDPDLALFSGTIPPDFKVRGNQLRYLFKRAMAGVLPPSIIKKTKHGFGLPFCVWLGTDTGLREFTFDVLGSSRARQRGYFRPDLIEWLWEGYRSEHQRFYGDAIWLFLMLELWHVTQHDAWATRTPDDGPVLIQST